MRHWIKRIVVAAAPLLLTGCLWGPGKFISDLTLKKDGSFVLDYRGEIVLQVPPDDAAQPWKPGRAQCFEGSVGNHANMVVIVKPDEKPPAQRACTSAEIAAQKAEYEEQAAKKRKDSEQMAKIFGLPGLDDESNRAFATKLMKYSGWKSVIYRGNGVFDVDYHFVGTPKQDFIFPALPDNILLIPFIALRRRADGSVLVTAPALTGGAGPIGPAAASMGDMGKGGPVSRAQGRFTIITDGEILTNNSEDGAAAHPVGRQLHWDVDATSKKIPEALIRL